MADKSCSATPDAAPGLTPDAGGSSRRRQRRFWAGLFLFLLGLAILAWVIYQSDPRQVWQVFLDSLGRPGLLGLAVGLLALSQLGFFLKWHYMSRRVGAEVTWRQSLRIFSTLYLVGTFTPGRAGELAVPLLMHGGGKLTGVALVNRIVETSITVITGAVALLLAFGGADQARNLWILGAVLAGLAAFLVVLSRRRFTAWLIGLGRRLIQPFGRWPVARTVLARWQAIERGLGPFYEANERLLQWRPVLVMTAIMVAIWVIMVASNYYLVLATVGYAAPLISPLHIVAVIAVIAVTIFVSPTPSGLGVTEFAAVKLFAQLGYPQNFMPFLLLSRLTFALVVISGYFVGLLCGRPLPKPAPADLPPPTN